MGMRVCIFLPRGREKKQNIMIRQLIRTIFNSDKQTMGLSITPEGQIEGILFDGKTKTIQGYANYGNLEFNAAKKMFETDDIAIAIDSIKSNLNINPKSRINVVLNLPNFYFDVVETSLDSYSSESQLIDRFALEAEQSFLFKKQVKPIISYKEMCSNLTGQKLTAFCAAPQDTIEEIKETVESCGMDVIAIENSYSSILKAIEYFDLADEEIENHVFWCAILINQNSYSVLKFQGDNLQGVDDRPLTVNFYEKGEVNYAVASVIENQILNYHNFDSIILVNNSSDINAQELAAQLHGNFNVKYIENNGNRQKQFFRTSLKVPQNKIPQISLFALGAAVYICQEEFILKFNLNDESEYSTAVKNEIDLFGEKVELSEKNCLLLALIPAIIIAVFFFSIGKIIDTNNKAKRNEAATISAETKRIESEIEKIKKQMEQKHEIVYSPLEEIERIMKNNNYNKMSFVALSKDLSRNMWLTYYYSNFDKQTLIRGRSQKLDDIYKFLSAVKNTISGNNLFLSKMVMLKEDDAAYEFEIANEGFVKIVSELQKNENDRKKPNHSEQNYKNSYYPLLPVSENPLLSPLARSQAEYIQKDLEEYKRIKMDELESIKDFDVNSIKKQLPPT